MANAEKLLHEAQFAFQSISFGQSRQNSRNAARAKSLSLKIIRRFPASMEAGEAHAILRRLGEEAYSSKINVQHQHQTQAAHHKKPAAKAQPRAKQDLYIPPVSGGDEETLNWGGLIGMLVSMPKALLAVTAFAAFFLFGLFGPFLFIPLVAFVLLTGPFRRTLKAEQREQMNALIVRVNDYIDSRAT